MVDFIHKVPIRTPRLILRPPTLEDLEAVHASLTNVWTELQQWMSWAYDGEETIKATERFILNRMNYQESREIALLAFDHEGKFVLSTGLNFVENEEQNFQTGYWVDSAFRNLGYATEATNAVIQYAFKHLRADTMYINYFENNAKSKKVIEKLGFEYLRTLPHSHKRCSDGVMVDSYEYILKDLNRLPQLEAKWS